MNKYSGREFLCTITNYLIGRYLVINREKLVNTFDTNYFWTEEIMHYQTPKIYWQEKLPKDAFKFTQKSVILQKPFYCIMQDCYIAWTYAYIFDRRIRLINESIVFSYLFFLKWFRKYIKILRQVLIILIKHFLKKNKSEPYCVVSLINDQGIHNIFHWIVERLTLLEAAEYYKEETWNDFKILLPQDCWKFQKDTLLRMGYTENDFIYWKGECMQVKNILLPSMRRYSESPLAFYDSLSHNVCQWLRSRMPMNKCDSTKRIYISREKSQSRRVLNEGVLLSFLEKNWFKKYILEELDANQQIDLFNNAEYVVWPHWAWFTNIMWSKTKTKVLEIMPSNRFRKDYFLLSCALWQNYALFIETSFNEKHDMYVDVNNFIHFFNDFIS